MTLKERFNEHMQKIYAIPCVEIGVVVKIYLDIVTPPKEKLAIIVGESADGMKFAVVLINSKINKKVHRKLIAQLLQIRLDPKDHEYIDWPSYVDCTQLIMIDKALVQKAVAKSPSRVIGWISNFDFEFIKSYILSAPTIKGKYKKKFGFYA